MALVWTSLLLVSSFGRLLRGSRLGRTWAPCKWPWRWRMARDRRFLRVALAGGPISFGHAPLPIPMTGRRSPIWSRHFWGTWQRRRNSRPRWRRCGVPWCDLWMHRVQGPLRPRVPPLALLPGQAEGEVLPVPRWGHGQGRWAVPRGPVRRGPMPHQAGGCRRHWKNWLCLGRRCTQPLLQALLCSDDGMALHSTSVRPAWLWG